MCEYCDGNMKLIPTKHMAAVIEPDKKRLVIISNQAGNQEELIGITHCPMCGRDLKENA